MQNKRKHLAKLKFCLLSLGVISATEASQPQWTRHLLNTPWNSIGKITIADWDNDGAEDILVLAEADNKDSSRVWLLKQNSDPQSEPERFQKSLLFSLPNTYNNLKVADINNDGHNDLVLSGWSSKTYTFLQEKDYFVAAPNTNTNFAPLLFADLNDDDIVDLIGENKIALSNGDGSFHTESFANMSSTPTIGLLDNDNHLDVAPRSSTTKAIKQLYWLKNDGQGQFKSAALDLGQTLCASGGEYIALDYDKDQDLDYVIACKRERSLHSYTNQGDGTWKLQEITLETDLNWTSGDLKLANINLTGGQDLLLKKLGDTVWTWTLESGVKKLATPNAPATLSQVQEMSPLVIKGLNKSAILWSSSSAIKGFIYNQEKVIDNLSLPHPWTFSYNIANLGQDIISLDSISDNSWELNRFSLLSEKKSSRTLIQKLKFKPSTIKTYDLHQDGDQDIFFTHPSKDSLYVLESNTSTSKKTNDWKLQSYSIEGASHIRVLALGNHKNRDWPLMAIIETSADGYNATLDTLSPPKNGVLEKTNITNASLYTPLEKWDGHLSVHWEDLDGNDIADLIYNRRPISLTDKDVGVYYCADTQTECEQITTDKGSLYFGDVDGDNQKEILLNRVYLDNRYLHTYSKNSENKWENTCNGLAFGLSQPAFAKREVSVADFDNDGDDDVVLHSDHGLFVITSDQGCPSSVDTLHTSHKQNIWLNTGDWDNDGDQDIVLSGAKNLVVWENPLTSSPVQNWKLDEVFSYTEIPSSLIPKQNLPMLSFNINRIPGGIQWHNPSNEVLGLSIFDLQGKRLFAKNFATQGLINFHWQEANLAPGNYFIVLKNKQATQSRMFQLNGL